MNDTNELWVAYSIIRDANILYSGTGTLKYIDGAFDFSQENCLNIVDKLYNLNGKDFDIMFESLLNCSLDDKNKLKLIRHIRMLELEEFYCK